MNSKSPFFGNQTCRSCISSETQPQQHKQTLSSSTGYYFIDFFKNCFLVIESKDLFDSNYTGFGIILSVELDWIMFDRLRPNCKLFLFEDLVKNSMIIAGQIYPSLLYLVKLFLGPHLFAEN
jgi:hypothetical protein